MIGLDTNILARYYVADASDKEASRQREVAKRLVESGKALMVCKTVLLEFEWVLRGYYGFSVHEITGVLQHLCSLSHVTVEDKSKVLQALAHVELGLDFADVLHHASYTDCESMATFDDKKFARKGQKLGLMPRIVLPD